MNSAAGLNHIPKVSMFNHIGLDQLQNPVLRLGAAYWTAQRGEHRIPARQQIKPRAIAPALRNMVLFKVLNGDFAYRVVGDAIVRAYSVPLQNRRLSEIILEAPKVGSTVHELLTRVVRSGEPLAIRGRVGHDVIEANFTDFENALLPLGADHQNVDHILTVSTYTMRSNRG